VEGLEIQNRIEIKEEKAEEIEIEDFGF